MVAHRRGQQGLRPWHPDIKTILRMVLLRSWHVQNFHGLIMLSNRSCQRIRQVSLQANLVCARLQVKGQKDHLEFVPCKGRQERAFVEAPRTNKVAPFSPLFRVGPRPDSTAPDARSVLRLSPVLKAPPACLRNSRTPATMAGLSAQTVLDMRLPRRTAPSACKPGAREAPARLRLRKRFRPAQ